MRFMMMIKSDASAEAGALPDQEVLAAMGKYNEELVKAGVMLSGEGLQPTAKGVRVRLAGKKITVMDGPFSEAKEVIAGFWLIQVGSRAEAIEWARRVPGGGGELELRALYELSDIPIDPSEQPEGWRDQEQRFREAADTAGPAAQQPARKPGTTRYMVMLKSDRLTESGAPPDPKVLAEMGALMEELVKSGALLSGEGLKPSAQGARVKRSGSSRTVIDGPFTEAKELIAGYSMIQVKTKEEAIDFARRWLQIHVGETGLEEGEIQIRPVFELSDLPVGDDEKLEGWRQQELRLRERLGQ